MTQSQPPDATTRAQLIRSACRLFAAHGYAGASISAIARELGLSKQALLHHFGTKSTLYALALEQTSAALLQLLFEAMEEDRPPEDQLERFFARFLAYTQADAAPAQLLMRELLDHARPPDGQASPAFATLLESLVATVQATEKWQQAGVSAALSVVAQLLGAAPMVFTAQTALQALFGAPTLAGAQEHSARIFSDLVSQTLRG
ncbi:TetR/AcrR family transcriptional regulator [Phaeobacter sp. HF9A]|uniref:TetR/AcrR family transcriptional regulator n=1 Tax=Phaeobacter sp. HF9A TaxID=2721561 RepID=UPI001430F884|nr:TetR/AcrR family transcriptional regulator [Phaeobacter sp. HF9A]NIZ13988.1 TetR/AcrR family transcriptional regulator [Phaeobacter sp. HF9A]